MLKDILKSSYTQAMEVAEQMTQASTMDLESKEQVITEHMQLIQDYEKRLDHLSQNMGDKVGAWHGSITQLLTKSKELKKSFDINTERGDSKIVD